MGRSRFKMNASGQCIPFFNPPLISSADQPWSGYHFEEANGPAEPLPRHSWPKTTLLYVTGGGGSLHWKHRGVWHSDAMWPGTVTVIRRDAEIQAAEPSNAIPTMVLQLDNAELQNMAPDNVLAIDKFLDTVQVTKDYRLAALMLAMSEEVRQGCSSGRLFAESISLALLAYVVGKYATPGLGNGSESTLSPAQKRLLLDYIRANLAENISVTELSSLLSMAPSHFSRVFKASFGLTPYRFVMHERVQAAKVLLASDGMTASQIAMAFGFATQSHFAKVFRQFSGVSPKQYKMGL